MELIILLAFVAAWVLGAFLSRKLWRRGRHWSPARRSLAASSLAALFFAPSLLVLGPAILPFPFLGVIVVGYALFGGVGPALFIVVPFSVTWLICLFISCAMQANETHDDTV